MKIISKADIGNSDKIYTVQLAPNTFVDVKHCGYEDLYYVMQCEDGWEVFNQDGFTIPGYEFDEAAVLDFVQQYASKNRKRVIQISLDIMVGNICDGEEFADIIRNVLSRRGYDVVGAGFQGDLTECYEEQYPEMLNTNKCS